jgi:hypothetical protein
MKRKYRKPNFKPGYAKIWTWDRPLKKSEADYCLRTHKAAEKLAIELTAILEGK